MKRFLSLFMILAMVLLIAAGCAAEQTNASEENNTGNTSGGVLKVAMECIYAPYNWTQVDDANGAVPIKDSQNFANGYDVTFAKKIAEALNMDLEIVKLDWDSLVPAVQSGVVDCVIAGQSITSERMESVDFSDPYYYASIVTLVRDDSVYADAKGISDLSGATCTSQLNTIWYDTCLPQIENANILAAQDSAPAMLASLNSGTCDLVVTDLPTAMSACVAYPNFVMLDFTESDDNFEVSQEDINIGISMKKGNDELRNQINSVLATLTVEDFNDIMEDAIAAQNPMPSDFGGRILFLLREYGVSLLQGAGVTMLLAIVGTFAGCVIGLGVGIVQTISISRKNQPAKWFIVRALQLLCTAYIEIFRGTPMMVQAMFIYFGAAAVFDLHMDMWSAAFFILSINTGAYMAESVRGGILSIDAGQTEGAKSLGMTHFQTMYHIILPQALRNIMPQIGNNLIINIKDTCVLSVIGTVELFYTTKGIAGTYYTFFEAYTITMVLYFVLTFTCSRILLFIENHMDGPVNYDLVMADQLVPAAGTYRFNEKKSQNNQKKEENQ